VLRELVDVLGLTLEKPKKDIDLESLRGAWSVIYHELQAAGRSELAGELEAEQALHVLGDSDGQKQIDTLLRYRSQLRAAREYELADTIRTELANLGIIVEDGPEGSTWREG
jgi:cysteinyl-tRNA synthetase